MDNIKFETHGWVFFFKPFLTFGQKRSIQKLTAAGMQFNAETTRRTMTITAAVIFDSQDAALRFMLVSATKPDGNVAMGEDAYDLVQSLHGEDTQIAEAVYNQVDVITGRDYLGETPQEKKIESIASTPI